MYMGNLICTQTTDVRYIHLYDTSVLWHVVQAYIFLGFIYDSSRSSLQSHSCSRMGLETNSRFFVK